MIWAHFWNGPYKCYNNVWFVFNISKGGATIFAHFLPKKSWSGHSDKFGCFGFSVEDRDFIFATLNSITTNNIENCS